MGLIKLEQIAGMNCHYYRYSLDYFFKVMERLGYKTIALWGGAPHFNLDYKLYSNCKKIRETAKCKGIGIKCFTASSGTYGYQMGMQPASQRKRTYQYFCNGIRAAAELETEMMTINSGWGYWNEDFDIAWERSKDMIHRLCDFAEREGIVLAMESLRNAESQLVYNLENTKKMYDEVNHPSLKLMLDTTAIGVAREQLDQWFNTFGSEIVTAHFIDGNPYGHLAWGDGNCPLEMYLRNLFKNNYTGILGLELTHSRYYRRPEDADYKNMKALSKFI